MFGGEWADVRGATGEPPGCKVCKRERDRVVDMTAAQSWQPGYVIDVWRCPACGHEVVRGDVNNETFL